MPTKIVARINEADLDKREKLNIGKKGLKIKRVFTNGNNDPYADLKFVKRDSRINNPDGSTVFELKDLEIPESWSQVATDILAQKYLRKRGVPKLDKQGKPVLDKDGKPVLGGETSSKQAMDRLAETWRYWGEKHGYFNTKADADAFEAETKYMLIRQMVAPNSPQWFNTGLHHKYGITGGAQGHYYVDPQTGKVEKSKDAYSRPQPHACFIQSIKDDLVGEGGIFDVVVREARLFKYGSGTGTNFSNLRGKGEQLSGGGTSSGLMSFLKVFDVAAGSIRSGGTTRRAAKMVCLDIDHPEIEDFIAWKVVEEQKVASLVAGSFITFGHIKAIMASAEEKGIDPEQNPSLKKLIKAAKDDYVPLSYIKRALMLVENGMKTSEFRFDTYDTDFRSEAYNTVSGQNSNNSIRVTNEFLKAVEADGDWDLINRTNGKVSKTVKARKLWSDIVYSAWASADPGLQFDTIINEWHTCPEDGRINASNPCSEYMFLDDTACNLASLNLVTFYDEKEKQFKVEEYVHACRIWTIILEISVLMSQLPSKEIAELTYKYRTLGLGYANLGSLLMRQGVAYDSERGFAITGALTAIMTGEAYATSAEMAKVLGTFERYNVNKRHMLKVIRNHRRAAYNVPANDYEALTVKPMGISADYSPEYLREAAQVAWDYALMLGERHGYRNAQTTVIAPTGTIGLLMDCDTTGIEPDFALVKFKKLVGGGYFKIVNQSIEPALETLGYSRAQIDEIITYVLGAQTLENSPYINTKTLAQKGFTAKEIGAVEGLLATMMDIRYAFTKWSLGEEFLSKTLKLSAEDIDSGDILGKLGFTDDQIQAANEYICGTSTIEGAPHLKAEHLPVFDCANKCGNGKRFIAAAGHIKQMAAAQPFITGSISKTINLPEEATFEDVEAAYKLSWELMLKSNALYRDGSKLSQPLNTANADSALAKLFMFDEEEQIDETKGVEHVQEMLSIANNTPVRKKLPSERHSITHKFSVGGHKGFITVGLYENGSPGEVFITMDKEGSTLSGIMDGLTYTVSIALQYGVPLESIIKKFVHTRFEPSGMTGNSEIPMAKSLIDYIGRYLALRFLPRERASMYHNSELIDRSYISGSNSRVLIPVINGKGYTEVKYNRDAHFSQLAQELEQGRQVVKTEVREVETVSTINVAPKFDKKNVVNDSSAPMCDNCGGGMRRSGSCYVCTECGSTSGCS